MQRPHGPGLSAADLQVLQNRESVQFEELIETAEGPRHFAISTAPLLGRDHDPTGICAVAVDVTSLKKAEAQIRELIATLEKRVEERTEELHVANTRLLQVNEQLKDANNQLEAFSYTVAHDLRAPLRGIQGFADALGEDYGAKLDETGEDYLLRITNAAARMERLIDDLLSFSRLSRMDLPVAIVSPGEIFRQVLANLEAQIRDGNAALDLAPHFPPVRANRTALLHALQNLVSNAVKFSRPDTQPRIRIRSEIRTAEHTGAKFVRIWVEDNGIGIPAAQLHRVFRPFERLHGVSEYPGSGIGLAIVETTVRRMHGQCGVESEVNVGSRFWVELPAA